MIVRALVVWGCALLALLAPASGKGADTCEQSIAAGPFGLPAPVVLTTNCGEYEVDPGGGVRFLGPLQLPVPAGSTWFPSDLSWYRFDRGRLLIGRGQESLWRSRGTFPRRSDVGGIALSAGRVSFSVTAERKTTLYVAGIRGPERPVALGESPLVWTTTARLLTTTTSGGTIRVRGARGRLERTVARRVWTSAVDATSHRLYFVAHGVLSTFGQDGLVRLAKLSRVGLGQRPLVSPLGEMVAVTDRHRLVVFRSDASRVSSTTLRRRADIDWAPGGISAGPDETVAFTVAQRSAGTETVYLLRPGAKAAVPIYSEHVEFAVCERGSDLAWQGDWLLYSASEGYAAAIDTDGGFAPVDLSALVQQLPGFGRDEDAIFDASWAASSS